jgi:hypothetical protein
MAAVRCLSAPRERTARTAGQRLLRRVIIQPGALAIATSRARPQHGKYTSRHRLILGHCSTAIFYIHINSTYPVCPASGTPRGQFPVPVVARHEPQATMCRIKGGMCLAASGRAHSAPPQLRQVSWDGRDCKASIESGRIKNLLLLLCQHVALFSSSRFFQLADE